MRSRVIERNMFYGASRNTFEKARLLRKNMTLAEKLLWSELKNRKHFKARFKRQHPIDLFIVDFYCHEFKLAIELDGEIHLEEDINEYDIGRTADLEKFGITILRFTNNQIFTELEFVLQEILVTIHARTPL
jgi:very-short-patch-repair endonuclease